MTTFTIRVTKHYQITGQGMTCGQPVICNHFDDHLMVTFPGSLGRLIGRPVRFDRTLLSAGDEVFLNHDDTINDWDFRAHLVVRNQGNTRFAAGSYFIGVPGTGGNQSGGWGGRG